MAVIGETLMAVTGDTLPAFSAGLGVVAGDEVAESDIDISVSGISSLGRIGLEDELEVDMVESGYIFEMN